MTEKRFVDIKNPERVNRSPNKSVVLFSGNYAEGGYVIQKIELRLYLRTNETKGTSLITSFVQTDMGSIEMTYEEGNLTETSLEKARDLLLHNLGMSGLVLRSIISLKEELKKSHS